MTSYGLYIHWPFCVKKCGYCDLNSHVRESIDQQFYINKLHDELDNWHSIVPDAAIETIFFGGGTPSLLPANAIGDLIEHAKVLWKSEPSEITLEANPTYLECRNLHELKSAGVNRMSFGVQTFNDAKLLELGRTHTSAQAYDIVNQALTIFDLVSLDLMYNLPKQTVADVVYDLARILDLGVKHVSYYALTIHANTDFGRMYEARKLVLPNEDVFCDSYNQIVSTLEGAGLKQYEISNFCAPGHESRHNLCYWRYMPFIGVGAGAHSRVIIANQRYEVENHKVPEKWAELSGHKVFQPLDATTEYEEKVLMQFRIAEGMPLADLPVTANTRISDLVVTGNMWHSGDRIGLTRDGFLRYNAILKLLLR